MHTYRWISGPALGLYFVASHGVAAPLDVVIGEVAWAGTTVSTADEWIELRNNQSVAIDLNGWTLNATDGTPAIRLAGTIPAGGLYLLERTDDGSVPGVGADLIYTGALGNGGEVLELRDAAGNLVDSVDAWYAGDSATLASMERIDALAPGGAGNWATATADYGVGLGTPKARNTADGSGGSGGGTGGGTGAVTAGDVVINEIAWMGSTADTADEWIELYNNRNTRIDLTGWRLYAADGSPSIDLSGSIGGQGFYLLERGDDGSVPEVGANLVYTGALGNTGEVLYLADANGNLVDTVNAWYAGDVASKATMERSRSTAGIDAANWNTAQAAYSAGLGTPGDTNSASLPGTVWPTEALDHVCEAVGCINAYFNKSALTQYATPGNPANHVVNLESRLIWRLSRATRSIDFATYEINLTDVVDMLIDRAAHGVTVRLIADAKESSDPERDERYLLMRLQLERMARGLDGIVGTGDDIAVYADSPIFAVEDGARRTAVGLPASPDDFPRLTLAIGSGTQSGYLIADGERKSDGGYYAPADQMHNKFAVIDGEWVYTGSWNYTLTGLYGTEENRALRVLDGNQQHVVELHSPELAGIYRTEFEEMWGAAGFAPNPDLANFHGRKTDNTPHVVNIGGRTVEVYFSPGDDAVGRLAEIVRTEADSAVYFTIFAWSDQTLVDELKFKWEGSYADLQGSPTGFDVRGVFDPDFYNQWWSASIEMTGRTGSTSSTNNPNIRWANVAPVYQANETRRLHAKSMLIDPEGSDAIAVIGSTNWSTNGNDVNDENLLVIRDADIANQVLQEFYARYQQAGGPIPTP